MNVAVCSESFANRVGAVIRRLARRSTLVPAFVFLLGLAQTLLAAEAPSPVTFESIRQKARELAAKDYQPPNKADLPDPLKNINYDQFQDIRFRPAKAPWTEPNIPFRIEMFHRGYLYQEAVQLHIIDGNQVRDVAFSADQFDYGKNHFPPFAPNLGFAGFKIVSLPGARNGNPSQKPDEVASFLGASYFRIVGIHQRYGAACRGLALDTAEPGGEEFPRFKEFWIRKPTPESAGLELYALLDTPSGAGAYRFLITPGEDTTADVEASYFIRKPGKKMGLAPLTSMFLQGKMRTQFLPDFRSEIHDSDGLLFKDGGNRWCWRPLVNPEKKHQVSHFDLGGYQAFGLMQRERSFRQYSDLGARYELRPSLWVQAKGNWGEGQLELVEIPTRSEWNDNIVAYWVPKARPPAGQEVHWAYRVAAKMGQPEDAPLLQVSSSQLTPAHEKDPARFVIDFQNLGPVAVPTPPAVQTEVHASHGSVKNLVTQTNEVLGGWRAFFDLTDVGSDPAELKLWLQDASKPLSETWLYPYPQ